MSKRQTEPRALADVRRFELEIDVGGGKQAVTVVAPGGELAGPHVLMCAFPGAGYSRGYYDIRWQGTSEYSEAEFHAARGWIVACVDHLGVGDSTVGPPFTFEATAAANAATVGEIVGSLRAGTLVPGLGNLEIGATLGVGQSMGGYLTILAQANHEPFDAIAVLGYGALGIALPAPDGGDFDFVNGFRWAFHWDDIDPALLEADMGDGYPMRRTAPPWGSVTVPAEAPLLLQPGIASQPAASIRTPVFLAAGERDVLPDPWAEPAAYRGSRDISLLVLPRMAHMHNFASTRRELWERLHAWGEDIAQRLK